MLIKVLKIVKYYVKKKKKEYYLILILNWIIKEIIIITKN